MKRKFLGKDIYLGFRTQRRVMVFTESGRSFGDVAMVK